MCRHAGRLDAIVAHEIARRTGAGCGCACSGCRRIPAYGAMVATPARRATRSGSGQRVLPAWRDWSPP